MNRLLIALKPKQLLVPHPRVALYATMEEALLHPAQPFTLVLIGKSPDPDRLQEMVQEQVADNWFPENRWGPRPTTLFLPVGLYQPVNLHLAEYQKLQAHGHGVIRLMIGVGYVASNHLLTVAELPVIVAYTFAQFMHYSMIGINRVIEERPYNQWGPVEVDTALSHVYRVAGELAANHYGVDLRGCRAHYAHHPSHMLVLDWQTNVYGTDRSLRALVLTADRHTTLLATDEQGAQILSVLAPYAFAVVPDELGLTWNMEKLATHAWRSQPETRNDNDRDS